MAPSYRKINYSLRFSKAVERKMLCEAFRKLYPFNKPENYHYIGFGSIYFNDFHLLHQTLGIQNMLSIEYDGSNADRFEFNKPYKCIELVFKDSNSILPGLDWKRNIIAWLDYDSILNSNIFLDIDTICRKATSGTIFLLSVNAEPESEPDDKTKKEFESSGDTYSLPAYRLKLLEKQFGSYLPRVFEKDTKGRDYLEKISYAAIDNRIKTVMVNRNSGVEKLDQVAYEQLFHITYQDNAKMLTVGGIFFLEKDREKFESCGFNDLGFIRKNQTSFPIQVPCLTNKEMQEIKKNLPNADLGNISIASIPTSDVQKFAELYRYFPTFAEAIII